MHRRVHLLATLALVLLTLGAGCTGTLVEYAASPATIPDAAVEANGYVHGNTTEVPVTYVVGAAGVTRNVTAKTWLSGYSRTTDDGDVAALVLYSSPNVVVENRSVNPLAQVSNRRLVGAVLDRVERVQTLGGVEELSDLREVEVRNVTVLGESVELVTYRGMAEVDGQQVAVVVNLLSVEHGDDVVVALGVHEASLAETATHARLVEAIEHAAGEAEN